MAGYGHVRRHHADAATEATKKHQDADPNRLPDPVPVEARAPEPLPEDPEQRKAKIEEQAAKVKDED